MKGNAKKRMRILEKVKRILVVSVAVALLVCGTAGCKSKASDKDEQGRTVISVGGWPQKEGQNLDNMNKNKANFEAENPDAVIKPDTWTFDLQTFYPKAEAGTLPTVYEVYFTEVSKVIDGDYGADLTETLKSRGYEGKFNQKILELVSQDGHTYAIPATAYILGLGCNIELFEQAGLMNPDGTPRQPKDWYELAKFAVQIKEVTGKPGFIFPTSNNSGGWMFTNIAWSFGVNFMEQEEDGKWKATFDTPECVEALQFIKDLKWKYRVLPENTLIDLNEYNKQFAIGNAGMLICANLPDSVYKYEMDIDKIGMMALPAGPKRHVALLGGSAYFVNKNATDAQIDAAVRWLETKGNTYMISDTRRENIENSYKVQIERKQLVGNKTLSVWSGASEVEAFKNEMLDKYTNCNLSHIKLYNEYLGSDVEIQAEEPMCAQDLYGILDNCIQEVLQNERADCAELITNASNDFQRNFLDVQTH